MKRETVNVRFVEFESDEHARRYANSDNKSGEWSDWDFDMLSDYEPDELQMAGFNDKEIEKITGHKDAPDGFKEVGADIDVNHECPKCGYEWSE